MTCKGALSMTKMGIESLPDYLVILIKRMRSDMNSIDDTKLEFPGAELDLSGFLAGDTGSNKYKFETAMCLENTCSYPVVALNKYNNRNYIFRN